MDEQNLLQTLTEAFRRKVRRDGGLDRGTLKFDFGRDGCIYIDGSQHPNAVSNEHRDAECTLRSSLETVFAMITGNIDGVRAFQSGQLTVEGDLRVCMAFGPIGTRRETIANATSREWTNNGNLQFPLDVTELRTPPVTVSLEVGHEGDVSVGIQVNRSGEVSKVPVSPAQQERPADKRSD